LSERLCAYAVSVAHFPTAIKEFQVRALTLDTSNEILWNHIVFVKQLIAAVHII
jgi:hypothetical protein